MATDPAQPIRPAGQSNIRAVESFQSEKPVVQALGDFYAGNKETQQTDLIPPPQALAINSSWGYPFGPIKDAGLWTKEGPRTQQDRFTEVDLGPGTWKGRVTRFELSNGAMMILGLDYHGKPAEAALTRLRESEEWRVSLSQLLQKMVENMRQSSKEPNVKGSFKLSLPNVSDVDFAQYEPRVAGHQFSQLRFGDERLIRVLSEQKLKLDHLKNIARVIASNPPSTYEYLQKGYGIFVLDQIGESRGLDGKIGRIRAKTLEGFNSSSTLPDIVTTVEDVSRMDSAYQVFDHEAGHFMDRRHNPLLSSSILLADGRPLFGSGQWHSNLHQTDFISQGAAANGEEDFAETHASLLTIWRDFHVHSNGQDLFRIPLAHLRSMLQNVSPGLQAKLLLIAQAYQQGHISK